MHMSPQPILTTSVLDNFFILKHDNDPKHISSVIDSYAQRQEEQGVLQQMVLSQQSTDLNIMESISDYMKRQKQLRQPKPREPW